LGQFATHAGSPPISMQKSHFKAIFLLLSVLIIPYGHVTTHVQQPMHLFSSLTIIPVSGSCLIAPVMHDFTHSGSSQRLHCKPNDKGFLISKNILGKGLRPVFLKAFTTSFLYFECDAAQYTSHNPHPTQYSSRTYIFF
jgi:hypothetical protein